MLSHFSTFEEMQQNYESKGFVFACVYIAEAHAKDEWAAGKVLSFMDQPKTIEQRCELAEMAKKKYTNNLPILVDNMQNEFNDQFSAWPFRFFGLKNVEGEMILDFKAQPEFAGYNVSDIENWMEKNL